MQYDFYIKGGFFEEKSISIYVLEKTVELNREHISPVDIRMYQYNNFKITYYEKLILILFRFIFLVA